jgi:hypothetical protein
MKYRVVSCLLIGLSACLYQVENPCSLGRYQGKTYSGVIILCDSIPGERINFISQAVITAQDSLLYIQFTSSDTLQPYSRRVILKPDCSQQDIDDRLALYNVTGPAINGYLTITGSSIILNFGIGDCGKMESYQGFIVK